MLSEIHVSPGWRWKEQGLMYEAQNGAGFGLWPEPALSKTRIMSSQLLRSLSRLLERERERERERAHERVGVSDRAMERENEKDGEIVKLIRQSLCGGRISMSPSLSCYLLELSCQGSPCERLSQQAGHRAAREEKMKPASWREVRETASNTLSLSSLSLRKHLELLAASSVRLILAHRKRETAVTAPRQKKNMILFWFSPFSAPTVSFNSFIGMIK